MEMPTSWFPMPEVMGLASYTDDRDGSSSCGENVSAEECQAVVLGSKWHNWYWSDIMFGQTTIIFLCTGLAMFTISHLIFRFRHRKPGSTLQYDPTYVWIAGIGRYLGNRQWRISRRFGYTLTLGQSVIIGILIIFFSAMTLGPKPYYWPNPYDFGGSPPLATRSGFLAIAILPFQVLLATKWNLITCLTGVSHEKLQVYHRWMGWIMYVLALLHTFPFIVVDFETGMMGMVMKTDWYTVSGIICLVPQTLLVTLSIAAVRDRAYEIFKGIHFVLAAFFIVFLFLHCGFTLTSAYYFVGLAAAYSFSWIIRFAIIVKNGIYHRANLSTPQHGHLLKVSIPTELTWAPGQHYFIRFLSKDAHSLTSHPFTVSSIPQDGVMEFLVKPKGGMTGSLLKRAMEEPSKAPMRVTIDGPYGGVGVELGIYDRVLLIAGGSGISFLLSCLRHLVAHWERSQVRMVSVVYTCKTMEYALEYQKIIGEIVAEVGDKLEINLFLHVSSEQSSIAQTLVDLPDSAKDSPKDEKVLGCCGGEGDDIVPANTTKPESSRSGSFKSKGSKDLIPGRPALPNHIHQLARHAGSAAVAACGPKELLYDVRNAVAEEQVKIIKGDSGCADLFLHTEAFGW